MDADTKIAKAIASYCRTTDTFVEDLRPKEVRLIAESAQCKPKAVFEYIEYWHGHWERVMPTKIEKIDGKDFKVYLPGHDEDWSEVEKALAANIKKHLGESKLTADWQRREGDLSEYPRDAFLVPEARQKIKQWAMEEGHDPEDSKIFYWSNWDTLQSLLDSASKETYPTHMAGSGLRTERVFSKVYEEMRDATCDLIRSINPQINFEDEEENDLVWDIITYEPGEWVEEILAEYSEWYLEDILTDLDKRKGL